MELGVAVVSCFLSSLTTFDLGCPNLDRDIRVVRGLYGFHLYANEFWVDYLLSIGTSDPDFERSDNELRKMLVKLNQTLGIHPQLATVDSLDKEPLDQRLHCLEPFDRLHRSAIAVLRARRLKPHEIGSILAQSKSPRAPDSASLSLPNCSLS